MLLNPGQSYTYSGQVRNYPDIQLIYWAGGNPYHHHQDLNRLRQAWQKPQTVIVNEHAWTATARHADIVFPATMAMERNDIVCGLDLYIIPSKQAVAPFGESRSDFEILGGLSARLGALTDFTENLDEMGWLERIYGDCRSNAGAAGFDLPGFDEFWQGEGICFEGKVEPHEFSQPTPSHQFHHQTISRIFCAKDDFIDDIFFDHRPMFGTPASEGFL